MKYLIVVDAQNDFITGSLGTTEADRAAQAIAEGLPLWEDPNTCVIFTKDTHNADSYLSTPEGIKLPVPHCIRHTEGWEIDKRIMDSYEKCNTFAHIGGFPDHEKPIVWKNTFGSIELIELLQFAHERNAELFPDDIVLCGFCTDICVISNALMLKAYYPYVNISVLADWCAGTTPENHQKALDVMKSCQIEVV